MIQTEAQATLVQTKLEQPDARSAAGAAKEENFLGFLTRLASRKGLIAAVTGVSGMLGVAAALLLPVRYVATTRIMTPQQTQSTATLMLGQLASSGGALAAMAGSGLGLKNPNDLYIGLLNSRPVADAIINKFGLQTLYRVKNMTTARQKLAANTSVISEKSGFLAVSVTDGDKARAAAMANTYTEQLGILTKTLAMTEASQRRLFYEEQLKSAKEEVVAAEFTLKKVEQQKGVVEPDAQSRGLITGLTELQAQAAAKQVEVRAMRSYSTEQNPNVQLAENQLASLEAEIQRLQQSNPSRSPTGMGLQNVAGGAMDYLRATHELQYRQTLFDLLMRQYDAARLDEVKEADVIQVVEPAMPPELRSSPHRGSIVLTFAILGFLSACSYLYLGNFLRSNPELGRGLTQFASALLHR